jgi:hypothetical protein
MRIAAIMIATILLAGLGWLVYSVWLDLGNRVKTVNSSGYTPDYPRHPDYSHGCVIGVIPGTNVLASVPQPVQSMNGLVIAVPCPVNNAQVFRLSHE